MGKSDREKFQRKLYQILKITTLVLMLSDIYICIIFSFSRDTVEVMRINTSFMKK